MSYLKYGIIGIINGNSLMFQEKLSDEQWPTIFSGHYSLDCKTGHSKTVCYNSDQSNV